MPGELIDADAGGVRPRLAPLPRLLLVVLFLGFAVLGFALVIDRGSPPPPPIDASVPRPTPGPQTSLPLSLEGGLSLARERARQWRGDARLILASARLDWLDGPPSVSGVPRGGTLTYTFAGVDEDLLGRERYPVFTVLIGRESGRIFFESEDTIAVAPGATVELRDLPVDSMSAFALAQRSAGGDYRAACPPTRGQVQVVLDTSTPAQPRWAVVYFDERNASHNDIVVRVDALSGTPTVDADADAPRACAPG